MRSWILERNTSWHQLIKVQQTQAPPSLLPCSFCVYVYCQPHFFSYLRPVWSIYSCLSSSLTLTCSASCCSSLYKPTNCHSGAPMAFKLVGLVVVLTKSFSPYSDPLPLILSHYPSETFGAVKGRTKKLSVCLCQAVCVPERDRLWMSMKRGEIEKGKKRDGAQSRGCTAPNFKLPNTRGQGKSHT